MAIRYATLDDLARLLHIEEQTFESDLIDEHHYKQFFQRNGDSVHILVDDSNPILGYILIFTQKGRLNAVIHSFAVLPEARGKGLGEELIEAACSTAKEMVCSGIVTHVRVDNYPAMRRYKKSGFKIIGAEADYYEDGCDSVKYHRKL